MTSIFLEKLLYVICIFWLIYRPCLSKPTVKTRFGLIQGITGQYSSSRYEAFLGIPYGVAPVGNLRFQQTVPFNSKWNGTYMATYFRPRCVSPDSISSNSSSEDCLYLNIWRPCRSKFEHRPRKLVPVLYFIHGGSFISGSGSDLAYRGDVLSSKQNVIVVNADYRLGALGFAYGHPSEMPGNLGIYDTLTVLRWIHDNIESFGGDPKQVTLSGQSAGSMIVSLISAVPFLQPDLYQRQFMMSGVAFDSLLSENTIIALAKTKLISEMVGCGSVQSNLTELPVETINCLRNVDSATLISAQMSENITAIGGDRLIAFLPVTGTNLLPEKTMDSNAKVLKNVSIIMGNEQDEVTMFEPPINATTKHQAYIDLKFQLQLTKKDLTSNEMDYFFNFYFDKVDESDVKTIRTKIIEFIRDSYWLCPTLILSEAYSLHNRVQLFENTYLADGFGAKSRPWGTKHGDDLIFFFGYPFKMPASFSNKDRHYSSFMMRLLADFVKGRNVKDWPLVTFGKNSQTVKNLTLYSEYFELSKQSICLKWAKLLNFSLDYQQ